MEEKEVAEKEEVPAADVSVTTAASSSLSSTTQHTDAGDNNENDEDKRNIERKRNNERKDSPQDRDEVEDDDDDSLYEHFGLLFEGSHPTTLKHFSWEVGKSSDIEKDATIVNNKYNN